MRVLIFGQGYLGREYLNSSLFDLAILSNADIIDYRKVKEHVQTYQPDMIANCAGKTGLEWCKEHQMGAIISNISGPLNLLEVARENNIYFVHIGSGCIFEGEGKDGNGFTETDMPTPKCFYAETKAEADSRLIKEVAGEFEKLLILRIRQPFSNNSNPRNIITKLLSYDKLIDSQNSMTYVPDLISATKYLVENEYSGIFNVCNRGTISPYQIADLARQMDVTDKIFQKITKAELDELDKQNGREHRVDAIININKLTETGFRMESVIMRAMQALEGVR